MVHLVAPEAAADLDEAWFYIVQASGSIERADRLVDAITDRFLLLSTHPFLGRKREDDLRPGLHSFAVHEYVIIYRITMTDDVLILRVVHGRQDLPQIVGS